jgi:hypothetical protein
MKHPDQCSLFDEPAEIIKSELSPPDFDALVQLFEMIDGESRIADDRLGTWASYERIDMWIARNSADLLALGKLAQTVQVSGHRGPRRVTTHLNVKQTRCFLTQSRLPHLRPYRTRVMIILDEYEAGTLVSTNAETTIRLQDATAAAEEQMPGSTQLGAVVERLVRVEQVATEAFTVGHQALKLAQAPPMKYPGAADQPRAGDPTTWRPIKRG